MDRCICPTSSEGLSSSLGLTERAKRTVEEIKHIVGNAPVIFIGYSQGGSLGIEIERLYKTQLNIVLNVTINAPIGEGAPVLSASLNDINAFVNSNQAGLNQLGASNALDASAIKQGMQMTQLLVSNLKICKPLLANSLLKGMASVFLPQYNLSNLGPNDIDDQGVIDMQPDSECTKKLREYVRKGADIPHLLIGTYADLDDLFDKPVSEQLKQDYAKLINGNRPTGDKVVKHDTMLPISSQCVKRSESLENINFDDIQNGRSIPVPKGCRNTEIYVFAQTAHADNLVTLHPGLFIKKGQSVKSSPYVVECVAKCIAKVLDDKSEVYEKSKTIKDIDLD